MSQHQVLKPLVTGAMLSLAALEFSAHTFAQVADGVGEGAVATSTHDISEEEILAPKEERRGVTEPIRGLEGQTVAEIRDSLVAADPDALLAEFLDTIISRAPDPKAAEFVLKHIRDLSRVLDGKCITYNKGDTHPLLAGEPSPYAILVCRLAPVIGLFPPAVTFDLSTEPKVDRRLSRLCGLQAVLDANKSAAEAFVRSSAEKVPEGALVFIPLFSLFTNGNGEMNIKRLVANYDSGNLADLAGLTKDIKALDPSSVHLVTLLFDISSYLKKESSWEIGRVLKPVVETALALQEVCPGLGNAYLSAVVSLEHYSLADLKSNAALLVTYTAGLIENGEPHPIAGLRSLADLKGRLRLSEELVSDLLFLNRETGFLRVSNLHDPRLDDPELASAGSAIRVLVEETARFLRNPDLFKQAQVASFVFGAASSEMSMGSVMNLVRDNGGVVVPIEVTRGREVVPSLVRVAQRTGRSSDFIFVVADRGIDLSGLSEGLDLGVTSDPIWFHEIDHDRFRRYQQEGALPQIALKEMQPVNKFFRRSLAEGATTRSEARLLPVDCAGLGEVTTPRTQVVLIGSHTGIGGLARRLSGEISGVVVGTTDSITAFNPVFGDDYRLELEQLRFALHPPTPAEFDPRLKAEANHISPPPQPVESVSYLNGELLLPQQGDAASDK